MNKQSLRKEIDKLQEESQKILFHKSLSKETKLFIQFNADYSDDYDDSLSRKKDS